VNAKVVVCTRDCGIIGFDYPATVEWSKRMQDVKGFVVMTHNTNEVTQAVVNAIVKYKVDYIVFMKYYAPTDNDPHFYRMYTNEVFSLFKVRVNL